MTRVYYGVYRAMANGDYRYVSRSATTNQKLAEEIARDLTNGEAVMPDGSTKRIRAFPHVALAISKEQL
jgi:hypothetical protein